MYTLKSFEKQSHCDEDMITKCYTVIKTSNRKNPDDFLSHIDTTVIQRYITKLYNRVRVVSLKAQMVF